MLSRPHFSLLFLTVILRGGEEDSSLYRQESQSKFHLPKAAKASVRYQIRVCVRFFCAIFYYTAYFVGMEWSQAGLEHERTTKYCFKDLYLVVLCRMSTLHRLSHQQHPVYPCL